MSSYTDEDVTTLSAQLADVQLSSTQLDDLATIWIQAKSDERKLIARIYNSYFTNANFVQRLQSRVVAEASARRQNAATAVVSAGNRKDFAAAAAANATDGDGNGGAQAGTNTNASSGKGAGKLQASKMSKKNQQAVQQKRRLLNSAIENAVCKLQGNGPHMVEYGVVSDSTNNQAVIDLYSTQFKYPDPPELARIVTVPRRLSTRTRQKTTGNYTWFLSSVETKEVACAVSVTVHKVDPLIFIEMPLFATNVGYKKLGLARLLNAALQEHCCRIGCDFIMVSADVNAVAFWTNPSLGYVPILPQIWSRIEFHYIHECKKFNGTELLIWTPPSKDPKNDFYGIDTHVPNLVDAALERMPKFVLKGQGKLPLP